MQEVKIKSIKKIEKQDRYDLTINSTKNFFANGILIHNTSWVVGNVLVKKNLNLFERFLKFIGFNIVDTEYDLVYSSRQVIKNQYINTNNNHFYGTDVWADVKDTIGDRIPKGYALYGELIGYTKDNKAIQKDYDYGCKAGESKIYVYRITVTNPDGFKIELTDTQIKEFCEKYELNYADTMIYYGKAKNLYPELDIEQHWNENFLANLERDYNEKDCYMCVNTVPEEGIVLRKENIFDYEAYKLKSFRFIQKESDDIEKEVVNMEDNQVQE